MELETSNGSKVSSPEARLLKQRGFDKEKAINTLTEAAKLEEVQAVLSALQLVMAKTYAKVLHKETGKSIPGLQDDLGISSMLVSEGITRAELEEFGQQAQATMFQHTAYSPLPSKPQALFLFQQVRAKLFTVSRAALSLRYPPSLPESTRLQPMTIRSSRVALELGFFKLMTAEQREEVFNLVGWGDLPKHAKLYFFLKLPNGKREEIMKEQDKQQREKLTADEYFKTYSEKP
ncbi:hypothetical protein OO185_02430 [Prosthecochloris sp. SCSIO W1102]|uniref:hypothetical protein n=1 Tax=Prosthecochloris sp. SCSIO W1102 TaxID=2992243 RepID=UPI00223E159C|nr:hypothetical protein [Prosthecochloris sp. SCSIO W1102]UZJ39977.1 hypothetical protein OO185_02430 [Prosthecochloris sp. SCSIO W1102]